jgi:hypothetical protein
LPKYYCHIFDGEILRLPDCPEELSPSIQSIFSLVKQKKHLALKPLASSKGKGFYKLSYTSNNIQLNSEKISLNNLERRLYELSSMQNGGYLITEYLKPCRQLAEIWRKSINSVRISVVRSKDRKPTIIGAYIRFGTEESGVVDNANAGGIACRIDLADGKFCKGVRFENYIRKEIVYHPDNHTPLCGKIPNWVFIKRKIIQICEYTPQVTYLAFDIGVTNTGFKILEINSHEGILFHQSHTPYLSNEQTKDFFLPLLEKKKQSLKAQKSPSTSAKVFRAIKKDNIEIT